MERRDIKIIFMGTPVFSVPVLETLAQNFSVVGVVTEQDEPKGRGKKVTPPPIKVKAHELGIPVFQPKSLRKEPEGPKIVEELKKLEPDFLIVAAYGKILPKTVLDIPKIAPINVHASLLPKLRGAAPIQFAILEGHEKTGITIMLMDEGMDTGDILSQESITIELTETSQTLSEKLSTLGTKLLIETLNEYLKGSITPQKQDDSQATLTKMIKKEDGKIDWNKTAIEIEQQTRAFHPWPGTFTSWNNKYLKILPLASAVADLTSQALGTVFKTADGKIAIACGHGYIILNKIQLEGKPATNVNSFVNGHLDFIGSKLE